MYYNVIDIPSFVIMFIEMISCLPVHLFSYNKFRNCLFDLDRVEASESLKVQTRSQKFHYSVSSIYREYA